MAKQSIAKAVRSLLAMHLQLTATGNAFAPLYSPLSLATVSHAVARLKRAWPQHNHVLSRVSKQSGVQADILMRKRIIVEVVRSLPAMRPRPTGTGNALAPLYSPLSIATVSHAVAQLKRVWAQHNHALVCALKDAHRDALASMHAELQAAKQERAAVIRAEAAVAARAAVEAREEDICAAQARVRVGEARRVRQAARRKVLKASRSIGAAAAAEGRLVSGQQLLRAAERSARAIATAGVQWKA
jgi:hypothetical protein